MKSILSYKQTQHERGTQSSESLVLFFVPGKYGTMQLVDLSRRNLSEPPAPLGGSRAPVCTPQLTWEETLVLSQVCILTVCVSIWDAMHVDSRVFVLCCHTTVAALVSTGKPVLKSPNPLNTVSLTSCPVSDAPLGGSWLPKDHGYERFLCSTKKKRILQWDAFRGRRLTAGQGSTVRLCNSYSL